MSNPRVTITLGRSGQVVERGGTESKISRGVYNGLVSGSKRSSGDGQWSDSTANKRRRGDKIKWSSVGNTQQDHQLSRNDLRLKLMRKRQPKQSQGGRDIHRIPQYDSEANGRTGFRKMPSRESADDLLLMGSSRIHYSSRAPNGMMRGRSPSNRALTSLGISPPRRFDKMWEVVPPHQQLRATNASRAGRFVVSGSRPIPALSGTGNFVSHYPIGHVNMQRQSSHMVDEPRTVSGLLHVLGLEKYAILFQAEEVDMTALRQMEDKDFKDLGLPMGPRKKIILALVASQPQQRQHRYNGRLKWLYCKLFITVET